MSFRLSTADEDFNQNFVNIFYIMHGFGSESVETFCFHFISIESEAVFLIFKNRKEINKDIVHVGQYCV